MHQCPTNPELGDRGQGGGTAVPEIQDWVYLLGKSQLSQIIERADFSLVIT